MEDIILSAKEHKLLKKFKKKLEKRYNVEIRIPKASSLHSDVIFGTLHGTEINRDSVKRFLSEKMNASTKNDDGNSVILITLSDSEEESSNQPVDESIIELSTENPIKLQNTSADESVIELSTVNPLELESASGKSHNDSVFIIDSFVNSEDDVINNAVVTHQPKSKKRKHINSAEKKEVRSKTLLSSSGAEASELCVVTSTTDVMVTKKTKLFKCDHVLEEPATSIGPAIDFIPLCQENKFVNKEGERNKGSLFKPVKENETNNTDIIVIDEPEPTVTPRCLRPIAIDGSNVAIAHGIVSGSFSVKGIKLAIDYFLNRGHKQVTAFVPKFRRSPNPNRKVPTTDAALLDELEKKQQVVFTPSRRINGKCFSSYDDRFIVQFAASNGAVIVSNDNYRDLINENDSFKEAIEQRLLMFLFVGDTFMVADDPLGRNGPTLAEFLSFPPNSEKS